MTKFNIALTAIFASAIVVGVIVFSMSKVNTNNMQVNLVVWGILSPDAFTSMYESSSLKNNKSITVNYVQKQPSKFESDLVEALADGKGPDIVIMREDSIYKSRNKLLLITYKNYSERLYKDSFIEASEIFLYPEGLIAFPLAVDPLVMYWNRDMFTDSLVAEPPKFWDDFYTLVPKMTKGDSTATITTSALAFGEWRNITNAKEILSMLLLQAGTPIVKFNDQKRPVAMLLEGDSDTVSPALSAVNFYTQFSNPNSVYYSWNRSLPTSLNFFLSGTLATYFGFSSELLSIREKNPNLNFDVTYVPQIRNTAKKADFSHLIAGAIVKQSRQAAGAFTFLVAMTEPSASVGLEKVTTLPPVRRSLLSEKPTDAYRSVFYNSALLSKSWIDPDSVATASTFRNMIESITSGADQPSQAISKANSELGTILSR